MESTLRKCLFAILLTAAALASGAFACAGNGPGDGSGGSSGDGPGCPDDRAYFQSQVYEPILGQKCIVCHSKGGLAGKSHLVLDPSSTPQAEEANFETARSVARMEVDGKSVLLLRPTGQYPGGHPGGKLIDLGTPEYQSLSGFVDRVVKGKCDGVATASCDQPARGARMLRRLTRSEYDATIHDLFGIPSVWGASFTADNVVNGFDNNAAALVVSPLFAEQARAAAEEIADTVFKDPKSVLPCDPAAAGESACAAQFIDTLGKRAFRRPLDDSDRARYLALYTTVAATAGFNEGAKTVVTAMLQSPHFLYRTELGGAAKDGVVTLTPYELASELSYLFWGTMPDAPLFAAADAGKLSTDDEIAAQAERLLQDTRSDAMLDRFSEEWLLVTNIDSVPKDDTVYPGFGAELRAAMREEIRAQLRKVFRGQNPTLPALFTSDRTWVSPALATFYGAQGGAPGADGLVEVDLSGTERIGILTRGAVLTVHAHPNDSSPIHRGKLVRTRVLCQNLPPPPAGLNVQPPPLDPSLTTRERYLAHSTQEPCKSCHQLMDPIGFGFERFDGVGRHRDTENGQPIDATGQIVSSAHSDGSFDGTADLMSKLAQSPDTASCFSLQWMRFAYGIQESQDTQCIADQLSQGFASDGLRIDKLLLALARSRHFTERTADPDVPADPDPGATTGSGTGSGGSAGSAGAGGAGQGGSGGGDPAGASLAVDVHQDSQWQAGYCSTVTVKNTGDASVTWEVSLEVKGTITDLWNAQSTPDGAKIKFQGVGYNATLAAGDSASFGFCASL